MKNILAENLLRFGVKNLSESDKTKLQEQPGPGETQETFEYIPLTISVPYKKDANGQMQFDPNGFVKFFAKNDKTNLQRFESITKLDFTKAGPTTISIPRSTKDTQGNILGKFSTYKQPNLVKYLTSMINKTLPSGDKSLLVTLINTETKRPETLYASTSNFVMYDNTTPSKI